MKNTTKKLVGYTMTTLSFAFLAMILVSPVKAENHKHEEVKKTTTEQPVLLSSKEIEKNWTTGNMSKGGISQNNLVGDPTKPGLYVIRLKFPDGYCLAAHSHPDSRNITVLQGEWLSGYGNTFKASALKSLPAGSFYTEPEGLPHFTFTNGETVLQVSGMGPSGRNFTESSDCSLNEKLDARRFALEE